MIRKARSAVKDFVRPVRRAVIRLALVAVGKWERAFVISCIAVALDPLFLYILVVDEKNKCLAMDKTLTTTVLVFRSLTDFLLLTHLIVFIFGTVDTDFAPREAAISKPGYDQDFDSDMENDSHYNWFYVISLIKCLAILPIPHVAILVGFFRLKGTESQFLRKFLNISLFLQYLPRIGQMHLSRNKFSMAGKWAKFTKPAFNFFLYIVAGHTLGAIWYFIAIDRETSCWHQTCRKTPGCEAIAYKCGDSITNNVTLLNQLCPVNPPNSTLFHFGMFAEILESGNTGAIDFPTKLFYTLWWGIKNLSNFGTNLETSSYLWENCFAILICLVGLLLFLYLIGNAQMYMQLDTESSLRHEERKHNQISDNKKKIMQWMKNANFPNEERKKFKMALIEHKVMDKKLVDVDVSCFGKDPFPTLSNYSTLIMQDCMLDSLGITQLKKLPQLKDMKLDDSQLRRLCRLMRPEVYQPNGLVLGKPQVVDQLFFVIDGEMVINGEEKTFVRKAGYYGYNIPDWAVRNARRSYYEHNQFGTSHVRASTAQKLEVLTLRAWDLLEFLESEDIKPNVASGTTIQTHQQDQPLPAADVLRWRCPDTGWLKLNCTAFWDPNNKHGWLATQGYVLRSDTGTFIMAGSIGPNRFLDRFHAGAQCIYKALNAIMQNLPPRLRATPIFVESDDKLLIDWIMKLMKGPLDIRYQLRLIVHSIIRDCVDMFPPPNEIRYSHCQPQSNSVAFDLARLAFRAHNGAHNIWNALTDLPVEIVNALNKDMQQIGTNGESTSAHAAEYQATTDDTADDSDHVGAADDIFSRTILESGLV
ncbi:cyclic nucleotide-gated ion channel 1-like [Argentina anserina]|uniref:cyclic nucleotide-gated ion channel 1-like n=1 Tax=Argentina anserina TaxID=57926 RepID=UPI0021763080|nr:cyclic nucleotide-gated ion channel 1-like [Potentilla anserina]